MSREQPDPSSEHTRRARGLLWFYVLLGAAAAIFALGLLLWRPLWASHWEGRVRAAYERGDVKAAGDALDELEALGPAAARAVARLVAPNRAWYRGQVIQSLGRKENRWMLPALVRLAREERDPAPLYLALTAAESMSGQIFVNHDFLPRTREEEPAVEQGRTRLLEWWERDGRAKHGG